MKKTAVQAATKDRRFSPINFSEIVSLTCTVSLLHSFEMGKDVFDWEIGVHGIELEFDGKSATFLPEVMIEENMTKEETLKCLAEKAGFQAKLDSSVYKRMKLERLLRTKDSDFKIVFLVEGTAVHFMIHWILQLLEQEHYFHRMKKSFHEQNHSLTQTRNHFQNIQLLKGKMER
jgi:hypothetical protein